MRIKMILISIISVITLSSCGILDAYKAPSLYDLVVERIGTGSGKVMSEQSSYSCSTDCSPAGRTPIYKINCGTDCESRDIIERETLLTAITESDSIFVKWTGCSSITNDNKCVVKPLSYEIIQEKAKSEDNSDQTLAKITITAEFSKK